MTDKEITLLVDAIKRHQLNVIWMSFTTFKIVHRIGDPPIEDNLEPSKCAFFFDGTYVALYNCDISDFAIVSRIPTH